jgi:uncharacterized protein (TIGR03067 family)
VTSRGATTDSPSDLEEGDDTAAAVTAGSRRVGHRGLLPVPHAGTADGASSAAPTPAAGDLDKLQGAWRVESSLWNGVADPATERTVTIRFEGDKFVVVDRDGNRQEETIRLMPDRTPKAIDCSSKGSGAAAPGIYSLEGDTFTWCSARGSNRTRPVSFTSTPGSKQSLMVLRRAKG